MVVGTAGFGFRSGEVWAAHVAWSGDHEHLVERLPEGAGPHAAVLGGGEALEPGELRLAPGETYAAPPVVFVHSTEGLDGLTRSLVRHQRAAAGLPVEPSAAGAQHLGGRLLRDRPRAPEAARRHRGRRSGSSGSCSTTAGSAAAATTARAWATGRSRPRSGRDGLGPLVDHVKGLGMEFGLWFEPEMVNLDSDLVRAHPRVGARPAGGGAAAVALPARARPGRPGRLRVRAGGDERADRPSTASTSSSGTTTATCTRPCAATPPAPTGPRCTRRRSPPTGCSTSCAPGTPGSRSSRAPAAVPGSTSGVLARTDRVWASDCNDALERVAIQRWTGLLVPPERIGTHVGPPARAHDPP